MTQAVLGRVVSTRHKSETYMNIIWKVHFSAGGDPGVPNRELPFKGIHRDDDGAMQCSVFVVC